MKAVRIFFDTNVLVYAHDESSSFHVEAATLIDIALEENEIQGIIAEQNLIELYRILTNYTIMTSEPLTPNEAKNLINETYLTGKFELVYPTKLTLNKTLELVGTRNAVSAKIFDLRLATLILKAKVNYFATYNARDFQNIQGLLPLTPNEILAAIAHKISGV
jgi:predicted nucleic acid-binding protein